MTDHSAPSAPVVDQADALPGARPWGPNGEPVNPPADGDDQRRCWNLLFAPAEGDTDLQGYQCLLFNGHEGEHQHSRADQLQDELHRYGGLIAVARNARETGQTVHVGLQPSCQDNIREDLTKGVLLSEPEGDGWDDEVRMSKRDLHQLLNRHAVTRVNAALNALSPGAVGGANG